MKHFLALSTALLLSACAAYDGRVLQPGISTEAEVRGLMGEPAMEFRDADGTRRLAYPRGPLGSQTYMADLGGDGTLRTVRAVLNDDAFSQIQPGLTRAEVLRMIGPPGDTMAFARSRQFAWDYRYTDTWGYLAIFSVTFDQDGKVVSKFSQRLERSRGLF